MGFRRASQCHSRIATAAGQPARISKPHLRPQDCAPFGFRAAAGSRRLHFSRGSSFSYPVLHSKGARTKRLLENVSFHYRPHRADSRLDGVDLPDYLPAAQLTASALSSNLSFSSANKRVCLCAFPAATSAGHGGRYPEASGNGTR